MERIDIVREIDGVNIKLVTYTLGPAQAPGVSDPKPGHQYLQTSWFYQNVSEHTVAPGRIEAICGGQTYEAKLFEGPANIWPGRPGESSYARWWFEVPIMVREVRLVYESPDGARGVWHLTIGSAAV